MGLRKQLREAEQEIKHISKSSRRSVSYQRKRQSSSSESDISKNKSATPPAECATSSDQSTILLTPSPSSDIIPRSSQYDLFSPPLSPVNPNASLSQLQPSQPTTDTDLGSNDDTGMDSDIDGVTPNNAPQLSQNLM